MMIEECISYFQAVCTTERTKDLFAFALERRLGDDSAVVTDVMGGKHPALEYAMHLYCNAYTTHLLDPTDNNESAIIISLMLAMEFCKKDFLPYGVQLRTDMIRCNINVNRTEWLAFKALDKSKEDGWKEERFELLQGNALGLAFHCAELYTLICSLTGKQTTIGKEVPPEIMNQYNLCWGANESEPQNVIESLVHAFVPAVVGQDQMVNGVEPMLEWLRGSSFYRDPMTDKGVLACDGGLSMHICNCIWRMVQYMVPETMQSMGEIVLAGLCHGFYRIGRYKPYRKVTSDNRSVIVYKPDNQMPLGSGFKSLYMASAYIGTVMPDSVVSAIGTFAGEAMHDANVYREWGNHPLGLFLHMACMIATMYDDIS